MSLRPRFETVALLLGGALMVLPTPSRVWGQQMPAGTAAEQQHAPQERASLEAATAPDIPVRSPAASPATVAAPLDLNKDIDTQPQTETLGDLLMARGRYLAAMHVYDRVLPRTAVIANKAGVTSEHMLMFDKAKLNFEEALRLDPKYAEAINNLATVYHSRGDLGRAEKLYRKAIQAKPSSADSWQNLGALYYSKRKFKKGDDAFHEALRLDPGILERSAGRGIRATGSRQNSAEIHYHLACTFAQAGRTGAAMDYLRRSIVEGFHDSNRMLHETMLADLRTTPAFLQLVEDMKKN